MLKKIAVEFLRIVVIGLLAGAVIGAVSGQLMFESAWNLVQTNPDAIQGDKGGYLCSAGKLPILLGVYGAALGAGISLVIGTVRIARSKSAF